MPLKKSKPTKNISKTELRSLAEEKLSKKTQEEKPHWFKREDTKKLMHELQVHQIELEMQNEELRRAHDELAESEARYMELYDLAPVGYCIINQDGIILETNLTATILLNVARSKMVKRPITEFILPEDQDVYYHHRKKLFQTGEPQICELRLLKKDGDPFWAHVDATIAKNLFTNSGNKTGDDQTCHVVMSDISGLKKAEEKLHRKIEELEQWEKFTTNRELKMVELKKEIDDLLAEAGKPFRYRINK